MAIAGPAHAGDWSGSVGLASDKLVHGISQSSQQPSLMLDLNYRSDTVWVAGVGLATLQQHRGNSSAELTLSLAKGWQLDADWLVQSAYAHYQYTDDAPVGLSHYDELSASIGWQGRVNASVALSPNTYSWYRQGYHAGAPRSGPAMTLELTANQRLQGRLAAHAGLGYYQLLDMGNWGYGYASVGLSWGWGPAQAYVSYVSSQAARRGLLPDSLAYLAGERCVGAVVWGF